MNNYFEKNEEFNKYLDSIGFRAEKHNESSSYYIKKYKDHLYELVIERNLELGGNRFEPNDYFIYHSIRKKSWIDYIKSEEEGNTKDNPSGKLIRRCVSSVKSSNKKGLFAKFEKDLKKTMLEFFRNDIRKRKIERLLK